MMVEAMDDSYIFATDLPGLQFFCLQMECFQLVNIVEQNIGLHPGGL